MCGPDSPDTPDPMEQAEADIERMRVEARLKQKEEQRARQIAAKQETQQRNQWTRDLGASRNAAYGSITDAFQDAGLSRVPYLDKINAALDLEQGSKSFGSPTGFSADIGENVLGDIRTDKVRELTGAVNKFAPEGFEQQAFGDTADDAILDAILSEQFGTASDAIMRAKERGNLNDAGFRYAMDNLNTQKAAGSSRLQSLGGGVLEGYRGQLGEIAERARTGASNWDFGDTFNPNTYSTQLAGRRRDLSGRLAGDIRNTVGGEQFFDINDLIAKGTVGQGAINTGLGGTPTLLAAIEQRKKDEEAMRGLGTQGSF